MKIDELYETTVMGEQIPKLDIISSDDVLDEITSHIIEKAKEVKPLLKLPDGVPDNFIELNQEQWNELNKESIDDELIQLVKDHDDEGFLYSALTERIIDMKIEKEFTRFNAKLALCEQFKNPETKQLAINMAKELNIFDIDFSNVKEILTDNNDSGFLSNFKND